MSGEVRKLQLIERLLMVSDDAVLAAVETVLLKAERSVEKSRSFKDFAGKIDDKELSELEQIIEQGCEQINPNDWK